MTAPKLKFSLYVDSVNSTKAVSRLYKILEFYSYTDYELSLVDIRKEPIRAQSYGITETPTLILHLENEDIVLSGDLSDVTNVRRTLGLKSGE